MSNDRADLEAIYRRWSTEKLVIASTRDANQYDPDSLPIMHRVLEMAPVAVTACHYIESAHREKHFKIAASICAAQIILQ